MVQSLEQMLVAKGFRMILHSLQDGGVGPCLVTEERTKQIDHGAMISPKIGNSMNLFSTDRPAHAMFPYNKGR